MIYGANTTVDVYHLTFTGATNTYPLSPDITGVEGYLESQRAEVQAVMGAGFNVEVMYLYIEPITISIGDKVVDAAGTEYRVEGIERHENNPDTDDLYLVMLHKQSSASH